MLSSYGIKSLSLEMHVGRSILVPNRRDGQTWLVRNDLISLFGNDSSDHKGIFKTPDGGVTAIDKGGITSIKVNPTPNLDCVGKSVMVLQAYREALYRLLGISRGTVVTGLDLHLQIPVDAPGVDIDAGKTQLKVTPINPEQDRFQIIAASSFDYVTALHTAAKGLWMCLPPILSEDNLVDNSEAGVRNLVASEVMGAGSWDDIPRLWTDAIMRAQQAQDAVIAGQIVLGQIAGAVQQHADA